MEDWKSLLKFRDLKSLVHTKELALQTKRTQTTHQQSERVKAEQAHHETFLQKKDSISAAALCNHHNVGLFFNQVAQKADQNQQREEYLLQQHKTRSERWNVQTKIVAATAQKSVLQQQHQQTKREENHQPPSISQSLFKPNFGG